MQVSLIDKSATQKHRIFIDMNKDLFNHNA